jgi:hypothetical protein
MEPKGKHVLQACVENAIKIGQAMQAIETLSATPGQSQAHQIVVLEEYLASLQREYAETCVGKSGA